MPKAKTSKVTLASHFGAVARNATILEQIFWFVVLVSWVPVITAYSLFPLSGPGSAGIVLVPAPRWLFLPYLAPLNLLVAVAAAIAVHLRRHAWLLALVFPLVCNMVPEFNAQSSFGPTGALVYACFIGGFILSVVVFLLRGHLLSPSFGIFSALLMIDALVVTAASWFFEDLDGVGVYDLVFEKYTPSPLGVLLFLVSAVFVRIVYLSWTHNLEFLLSLRRSGELKACLLQALGLWWPMPLIFALLGLAYAALFHFTEAGYVDYVRTYVADPQNGLVDPSSVKGAYRLDPPRTADEASLYLERAHTLTVNAMVDSRAKRIEIAANATIEQAADSTVDSARSQMPRRAPGTRASSCGELDLGCHLTNLMKSIANSIYQSFRRDFLNDLQQRLDRAAADAKGDIGAFRKSAVGEVNAAVSSMSANVEAGIRSGFDAYRIIGWVSFIYSLIILLKTYLIVLARVIFQESTTHKASIEDGAVPDSHGDITVRTSASSNRLRIESGDKRSFFVSRRLGLTNHPQAKRHPRPFAAFLTRLVHRAWTLNLVDMSKRRKYVEITTKPPSSLVEWKLKPGERAIFSFANFAAMTSDLRLERIVTLSVSGLIFGRIVYYCAEGPGTLILRTNNPAIVSGNRAASLSYAPASVVSWDSRSSFKIDANLNINDTFRSGINILKSPGDNVVIDTDSEHGMKMATGIMTYIKSFLLPI